MGIFNPSIEILERISEVLNLTLGELFDFGHEAQREEMIEDVISMIKTLDDQKLKQAYRILMTFVK